MSELLKELNKLQLIKVGRLHNKDQKQANLNEIKSLEKTTKEELNKKIKMIKNKNYVNVQFGTKETITKELLQFATKENIKKYHQEVGGKQPSKIEVRKENKGEIEEKLLKTQRKNQRPIIERLKQQLAYLERNPQDKVIVKRMKEIISGKKRSNKLNINQKRLSKFTISFIVKKLPKLTQKIKDLLDIDLKTFKLVPIETDKKIEKKEVKIDDLTKKEIEKFEKDLAKELEDPEKFNELFGDLPKKEKVKVKVEVKKPQGKVPQRAPKSKKTKDLGNTYKKEYNKLVTFIIQNGNFTPDKVFERFDELDEITSKEGQGKFGNSYQMDNEFGTGFISKNREEKIDELFKNYEKRKKQGIKQTKTYSKEELKELKKEEKRKENEDSDDEEVKLKEKPKEKKKEEPKKEPTEKDEKIKELQNKIKNLDKLIKKEEKKLDNLQLLPYRGTDAQKDEIEKKNEKIESLRIKSLDLIATAVNKRRDLRIEITDLEEGVDKDEEAKKKKVGIKYGKKILKLMKQYIKKPSKKLDQKIEKLFDDAEEEQEGATEEIDEYLDEEEADIVEEYDEVKQKFDKNIKI